MYDLGKSDARQKYPYFRWYRHHYLKAYKAGWNDEMNRKKRREKRKKRIAFWNKIKRFFTRSK